MAGAAVVLRALHAVKASGTSAMIAIASATSAIIVAAGAACLGVGMLVLSFVDEGSTYASLVPGMIIVGVGVGLFYSAITTIAVTALDPSRASLAGGIVYMCQIAGGAVVLGLNTAIVAQGTNLVDGISIAFLVDAVLAFAGLIVVLVFIRPRTAPAGHENSHPRALHSRHRAHA